MPSVVKVYLSLLVLVVFEGACRGAIPPTEPPRSGDAAPGTRTNDTPLAAPLAGDGIPASGGTSALPTPPPAPPPGGSSSGGGGPLN